MPESPPVIKRDLAFELAGGAVAIGSIAWTRVEFGLEAGRVLMLLGKRRLRLRV